MNLLPRFYDPDHGTIRTQLGYPESLGIGDPVEEGARAVRAGLELGGLGRQWLAQQDVVAKDAAERLVAHEIASQADRVGNPQGAVLVAIGQVQAEMRAIGQELHDIADTLAAHDHHHLADAHPGQGRDRVIDHRPVVDREQVLVGDNRQREQAGGGSAGEDDAFHRWKPSGQG